MRLILIIAFCGVIVGCVSAKLSGTGINVHDAMHGVEVQANTINAEINSTVPQEVFNAKR